MVVIEIHSFYVYQYAVQCIVCIHILSHVIYLILIEKSNINRRCNVRRVYSLNLNSTKFKTFFFQKKFGNFFGYGSVVMLNFFLNNYLRIVSINSHIFVQVFITKKKLIKKSFVIITHSSIFVSCWTSTTFQPEVGTLGTFIILAVMSMLGFYVWLMLLFQVKIHNKFPCW